MNGTATSLVNSAQLLWYLVRHRVYRFQPGWLVLTAILLGLALGIKMTLGVMVVTAALFVLWHSRRTFSDVISDPEA